MRALFAWSHSVADVMPLDHVTRCRALIVACSTVTDEHALADGLDAFLAALDEGCDQPGAINLVEAGAWPPLLPSEALSDAQHSARKACGDEPIWSGRSQHEWSDQEAARSEAWTDATQKADAAAASEWRPVMGSMLRQIERALANHAPQEAA